MNLDKVGLLVNNIFEKDDSNNILSSVPETKDDSLFLSVFNNNQTIMLLVDSENNQKILDANESALKFYGYIREEILQLDMGSINTTSEEDCHKIMKKAIKLPHSSYQFEHKTSSGLLKTVEVNVSPVIYKNKKVMFIIVHDITKLIKTELELKKSNEQFELAMTGSNLGLWDWRVETGDLHINKRWAEMLGYSLEEMLPVSNNIWRDLCHPDDLDVVDTHFQRYLKKETDIYRADFRMKHKDGSWIWLQTNGKVFEWTEDGKPLRVAGTHLDINDKKIIEIKLADSEERLGLAFAGSSLGLWDWWVQTGEAHLNERWAEIIGYTLDELSPVSIKTWEDKTHPDDLKGAELQLQK
ncbi:MAG: PAS domain S-box protein, partial [Spirochaetales bacterium]|nr:PAS domain S-box protein [Spirochaetales bacterium]